MLPKETKDKINRCRDILVGQLPLPSDQVELITIALIYKFMDDIDEKSRKLSGSTYFFRDELKEYSWQSLMSNKLSSEERVTKFIHAIDAINKSQHIEELFKNIFKNTFLKFRDGRILKLFMDEINTFEYSHSEELGNAFEYLLNSMGTQGENGQFRTPRNIIDFIVEVVDPDKNDKILDPACGTAGFLISAYKHILRKNTTGYEDYRVVLNNYDTEGIDIHWGDKLLQLEKDNLSKQIMGYDITPLMVRLSQVNMYLHHFPNPLVHEYDTLSNKNRWNEKFDCILANPPFMTPKGGILPHPEFRIRANKAEILFSDYILEHLSPNGKAGWIVPEGIIFQGSNDYIELRKWLIEEMGLWAVVSLPAQIFQPYSGVKTSILLVDRAFARTVDNILLLKIENDGRSLNTNRNPIKENDLPAALNLLTTYKKEPAAFNPSNNVASPDFNVQYKVLHRKEFAKLDSYKALTAAVAFCKKEYKAYLKASERQKAAAQLKFLQATGLPRFPNSDIEIKSFVEKHLKEAVINYGAQLDVAISLPAELKKHLDYQKEYNLNFDNYSIPTESLSHSREFKCIGDICNLVNGKAFKPTDWEEEISSGFPIIRIQNLNNPAASFNYFSGVIEKKYFVENGDLLFSWSGSRGTSFGPHFWRGQKAVLNQHIFRVECSDVIRKDYFYWALKKIVTEVEDNLHGGVGLVHITKGDLEKIKVPVPPLEIQLKIVSEIEQYQKVIDGCNLIIQNYKPTFKINPSWAETRMDDLCQFVRGPFGGSLKKEIFVEKGFKVYEQKHAIKNDFSIGGYFIDENKYKEMSRFKLEPNDIIMSCSGTFGKVAIAPEGIEPGIINQALLKLRPNNSLINTHFLKMIMDSYFFQNQLNQGAIGVAIQNVVSVDEIKSFIIPLPSLAEQEQIVIQIQSDMQAVENCKALKTQMEAKIQEVIASVWQS